MPSLDQHSELVNDAAGLSPRRVYWRGRQWCVTDTGLETNDGHYDVGARILGELTAHRNAKNEPILERIRHITEKRWVDVEDLFAAFSIACHIHGVMLPRDALLTSMGDARRGRWMDAASVQAQPEGDDLFSISDLMSAYAAAGARLSSYMAETGRDFREVGEDPSDEPGRC